MFGDTTVSAAQLPLLAARGTITDSELELALGPPQPEAHALVVTL